MGGSDFGCGGTTSIDAPAGQHLVAIYGNVFSQHTGNNGAVMTSVGAYWGSGVGSGQWIAKRSCPGCGPDKITVKVCTTDSSSKEVVKTSQWSLGVENELSTGFSVLNEKGEEKFKVTAGVSASLVTSSKSSFEMTSCEQQEYTCDKAYLWQWVFTTNVDHKGMVMTETAHQVCTDQAHPCCLPTSFSIDPTKCDLDPNKPHWCAETYEFVQV